MINNVRLIIYLFLLLALLPAQAFSLSVGSAHTIGQASAKVVETLTITGKTPLSFGYVVPTSGGSVTISPKNQRTVTGGVLVMPGGFERATFTVSGKPNRPYTIHTPDSVTFSAEEWRLLRPALDHSHLAQDLVVTHFVTYSENSGTSSTGKIGGNGKDKVYLGGTLIVPSNAMPGTYKGLVPLTVSY